MSNSKVARTACLIQVLFTLILFLILVDVLISYSTLSAKKQIEQAICPDLPPSDTRSDSDTAVLFDRKQLATFVITCGTHETDAINEMGALLKSLLSFASEPVRLIFITDAAGADRLWKIFAIDLLESKRKLRVDIHLLQDSVVDAWAAEISLIFLRMGMINGSIKCRFRTRTISQRYAHA